MGVLGPLSTHTPLGPPSTPAEKFHKKHEHPPQGLKTPCKIYECLNVEAAFRLSGLKLILSTSQTIRCDQYKIKNI